MKKIYLSIPYTGIEDLSFKCANEVSALLIDKGYYVFSPISHSHPIEKTNMITFSHDIWMKLDKLFIDWADEMWVVNNIGLAGMELISNSKGVKQELEWAYDQNKPIKIVTYDHIKQNIVKISNGDWLVE